jgi:FtsH-binding integral membrane protein
MNLLRARWYQLGLGIAVLFSLYLLFWHQNLSHFKILLGVSLVTLLLHQFEEYQFPGGFPRMVNKALFNGQKPDRYPLNSNTALIINLSIGWTLYFLAFLFAEHAVWLAIASMLVSFGNVIAHVFLFNIKGRTFYNPGMFTALVLFLPITIYFFSFMAKHNLIHSVSFTTGLVLGVLINYFGVLRLITFLADKNTAYVFKTKL